MVISNTWSNPVWSRFCPRLLMTLLRGSNQGGKRCSFQSYSASHITWTVEARFIARPLSALVQTIYGSVGHVNFLHLGAFSLFYRMNELQNELYESKGDLRSRMNNLSGWKRTWKNSGLTGNRTLIFAMTGRNALSIEPFHSYNIWMERKYKYWNSTTEKSKHRIPEWKYKYILIIYR